MDTTTVVYVTGYELSKVETIVDAGAVDAGKVKVCWGNVVIWVDVT